MNHSQRPPYIVSRVSGGLGNQMFQYAAAKTMADRNNVPLFIDTTLLDSDPLRKYGLDVFRLSSTVSASSLSSRVLFRLACARKPSLRLLTSPLRSALRIRMVTESVQFRLDPGVSSLPIDGIVCLDGYWQSAGYFTGAESVIRRDFTFRDSVSAACAGVMERILACNAISVHVRRTDYLTLKNAPVLSLAYYKRAWEIMAFQIPKPSFFVFADDIAWAREHFTFADETTFVDVNTGQRDYEDLRLMSACKHHITANSSFSWWGAWLNPRPEKLVVVPKYWMCRPDTYFPELFPLGWTVLENIP